ncbi:MAG TPA: arginase [Rheinheimera sp.]|nr:arginase [Rheinheimera sp.]
MNKWLDLLQAADLSPLQQLREGETRLGESLQFLNPLLPLADALENAVAQGCKYAIVGIPEDIGPRANLGNGGAELGFQAFLSRFLNLQHNETIQPQQILLLGSVHCNDLLHTSRNLSPAEPAELAQLRGLCTQLDARVADVLQGVFAAGLIPIVIGGGHNNALPILQALATCTGEAADAINLDPHCDFRLLEGRHSGNGFSYAHRAGWLRRYFVLGLHEQKNSQSALQQMREAGVGYRSYQEIYQSRSITLAQAIDDALTFIDANAASPLGIELDTDSISGMPVSAMTNTGVSVSDAEYFVYRLASLPRVRYLHLAEAAPAMHPAGLKIGLSEAGQILSALVLAFIAAQTH